VQCIVIVTLKIIKIFAWPSSPTVVVRQRDRRRLQGHSGSGSGSGNGGVGGGGGGGSGSGCCCTSDGKYPHGVFWTVQYVAATGQL